MDGIKFFQDSRSAGVQSPVGQNIRNHDLGSVSKDLSTESLNGSTNFSDTLKNAIGSVDQLQKESDVKMQGLATGQNTNIHDTMIASEKADIAFRLMVQVRNKIIEAYQEIMRMQV